VVDGSVKRLGGKFSIQLRFSCGTSGFQLWAHRYSVGIEGVLEVSDEATSAIAKALSLDGTGTPRQGPTDPRAIELYLKARQAYHGFWIESTQRAVALFQEALLLAPNDPLLLAGAALAEARLATHFQIQPGQFNPEQLRQQAELHALKALESNHHSGEARLALAALSLHGGDTVQGAARLRDALQEAPGLADVHDLMGRLLVEVGELHAGRTHLELAVALEPRLVPARLDLGRLYFFLNDIPKSDEILAEALRASGSLSGVWVLRARLAMWARDQARARTVLEEAEQARFPFMLGVRQMCSVTLNGRATPEHVEFLKNASRHTASRRMLAFFNQLTAEIMALSHRDDEALQAIEAAVDVGLLDLTWLEHCPLFAHLKHHEIYRSAQQRLSLQASRVLEQLTR
jgi:serine/threonine-protein kinase